MRVLALGGSGGMGRYAARVARELDGIDRIVAADLNAKAARAFATSLGGNVDATGLDVTDEDALKSAMRRADVVLNCVGPFFRFGPPTLRTAIECGCHYLDICDDWEPTLDMLAMDSAARDADITAVIGLGASPGLSNMLALLAMRELGTVSCFYTGWSIGSAIPEDETSQEGVNAAMVHAIRQLTGTVRVLRNGSALMVRSLEKVELNYPGVGVRSARIFGHPEAITFPHHYPELRTSLNVMHGLGRDEYAVRTIRWLIERGWLSTSRAARLLEWLEQLATPPTAADLLRNDRLPPIYYGLAIGEKNGVAASAAAALTNMQNTGMGVATGIPLACGLELLLRGVITRRGVFAPEAGAIDPIAFFAALNAKASQPFENAEEAVLITRSWEPDVQDRYADAMARARIAAGSSGETSRRARDSR